MLLAITISVILFTVVLKDGDDEEAVKNDKDYATQQCIEKNTKEVDMMRRFAQMNTNGD